MSNTVELRQRVTLLGSGIGILVLAAAGFVAACGSSEDPAPGGSGGSTGAGGSGGGSQASGGSSSNTGGGTSSNTGGGTASGTGGAATGSGGASGGTTATGGAAAATGGAAGADPCADCVPAECTSTPIAPSNALVTDWADVNPADGIFVDGDAFSTAPTGETDGWWLGFFGGPYVYPVTDDCNTSDYPLTSSVTGGAWNITGTVGTYSGAGLWFGGCAGVDFSQYTGVSFTISGTVTGTVTFNVVTAENLEADCFTNVGACVPTDTAPCTAPSYAVTVTDTQQTVTLTWADLTGGSPNASVNPAQITGLQWVFTWDYAWSTEGGGVPADHAYDVNVTIDNITLLE